MPTGLEAAAAFIVLIVTGVLADAIRPNGKLRNALETVSNKRQTALDAHAAIPEVVGKVEQIDDKVDRNYQKTEEAIEKTELNAHLISEFHGDEDIDVTVDDVLDDDDFYRGGDEDI